MHIQRVNVVVDLMLRDAMGLPGNSQASFVSFDECWLSLSGPKPPKCTETLDHKPNANKRHYRSRQTQEYRQAHAEPKTLTIIQLWEPHCSP